MASLKKTTMKTRFLFLISMISILYGCDRSDVKPAGTTPPKLLWQHPLTEDLGLASTITPVAGENVVVYSHKKTGEYQSPLMGLSTTTGEVKWRWDDLHPDSRFVNPSNYQYSYGGIMAYSTNAPVYGIEINSGKVLWGDPDLIDDRGYNEGFGDIVLNTFQEPQPNQYPNIHLGLANISSGDWRMVYTLAGDEYWRPTTLSFTGHISPIGDTIIYVSGSLYNLDKREVKSLLSGYNITQKKELFRHEGTETFGYLARYKDRLIAGGTFLRSYQAYTGELLWQQDITASTGIVITGNKVLLNNAGPVKYLFLYDIETGKAVWQSDEIDTKSGLIVHKGIIYATGDGKLKAVSLKDGQLLWEIESPNAKQSGVYFARLLTIDPKTDRLYTADYRYALCYQLE